MTNHTAHSTSQATAGSASCKTMGGREAHAKALTQRTVAGDMVGAFRLVRTMEAREAADVLLTAGFSVLDCRGRHFWPYVQQQITRACRAKVDGYGLRALPEGL